MEGGSANYNQNNTNYGDDCKGRTNCNSRPCNCRAEFTQRTNTCYGSLSAALKVHSSVLGYLQQLRVQEDVCCEYASDRR